MVFLNPRLQENNDVALTGFLRSLPCLDVSWTPLFTRYWRKMSWSSCPVLNWLKSISLSWPLRNCILKLPGERSTFLCFPWGSISCDSFQDWPPRVLRSSPLFRPLPVGHFIPHSRWQDSDPVQCYWELWTERNDCNLLANVNDLEEWANT